jgi:hypothetical protein
MKQQKKILIEQGEIVERLQRKMSKIKKMEQDRWGRWPRSESTDE